MGVELVYETHSITVDNETGIATGWLPGELSRQGRVLARQLGLRRRDDGLSAVFSSDLRRAMETAELAFSHAAVPLFQDARLRECDYGELNGRPVRELQPLRSRHITEPWPGGQSYLDVVEQTRSFLHDLVRDWNGARLLVIAHSANRWALDHLFHGRPLEDLVDAPFDWRPGWTYHIPDHFGGRGREDLPGGCG
ncbi:histidine phosphatase family protein [Sphaerisporangium dianthi]|uniref:Histidine phosphatase family protein n=1 Tax=Sphaerisporangium dianthi TaxID=1436120 RepID=A0ABV9CNT8_9ACTN